MSAPGPGSERRPPATAGFPRMMKEPGDRRVFTPGFVHFLARRGVSVFVEEGYGARAGIDYTAGAPEGLRVRTCSRAEAFRKDLVFMLRSPRVEEMEALRPGSCLISMLHFPTRPRRVETLRSLGVDAISLDGIEDDGQLRLVENMKAVAWNGLEAAFNALARSRPGLERPDGGALRVLILGTGMVGKHAVEAAAKTGNVERNERLIGGRRPGVVALSAGRNLTGDARAMEALLRQTDILVDATQRRDSARPVIPNGWLRWLPPDAVIADLAVDPYALDVSPPVVRGIEGIPRGDLDKYCFAPDDPDWDRTVPAGIPSAERRTVVSCYSWPGVHPEACMEHYARQLMPLMEPLLRLGCARLSPDGGYFERALYRGTLRAWAGSPRRDSRRR